VGSKIQFTGEIDSHLGQLWFCTVSRSVALSFERRDIQSSTNVLSFIYLFSSA